MASDPILLAGPANPQLADAVASQLGLRLGACEVDRFPDGELSVRLLEPVRRKEVFILQPTSPPVDGHLMELFALADVCRRSAAARITAVVPYFGYARADKRAGRREPITASMVAALIQAVGIDHLVTVDLHTPQIEGFFHIPVDSLTAVPLLCDALRRDLPERSVVVSPDAGRVRMATHYASLLGLPLVVLVKHRESGTETQVSHPVGDVQGRACLIVDDMISTAGTMETSIQALLAAGARRDIMIAATHALLLDGARAKLEREAVKRIFVTDTAPAGAVQAEWNWPGLRVVSVAPLITATIRRFLADESISDLL